MMLSLLSRDSPTDFILCILFTIEYIDFPVDKSSRDSWGNGD